MFIDHQHMILRMEECNVCGDNEIGICHDCGIILCSKHDFQGNHHSCCAIKNIEHFLYVN